MKSIKLIDMPFSLLECPAFGLTQLKTYTDKRFKDRVETEILYLNHDFFNFMGRDFYKAVNHDFYYFYKFDENKHMWVDKLKKSGLEVDYFNGGLGDWFFRNTAFPDAEDNTEEFLNKFYAEKEDFKEFVLEKRKELDYFLDELIDKYEIYKADIVGFTSRFQQQVASIAMAAKLKKINGNIITLIGGPNCEPPAGAELAKNTDQMDYVLSGRRFLKGFGQLIQFVLDGEIYKIDSINGVYSYKQYTNKAREDFDADHSGYSMGEEDEISEFIDLDYSSYFESIESKFPKDFIKPVLFFETSRGCLWGQKTRCTFCAIDGYNPEFRVMEKSKAIEYFENLFKYADKCKYFIGTDSCFPKEYLTEVFPYVNVPEGINILYEVRVDFTEREMKLLALNNINLLIAGIEALSTDVLKLLNKGTTAFDNIKFLKNCRKYGLNVNWNILVGVPGETNEMIERNTKIMPAIYHLYPPTGVWLVSFQGNCEYNCNPDEYGLRLKPLIESYQYAYPFQKKSLEKMTYFKDIENKKAVFDAKKSKAIQKTSYYINLWKDKWRNSEKHLLPNLVMYQQEGRNYICDTREAIEKIYEIDSIDRELLQLLNEPMSISQIVNTKSNLVNLAYDELHGRIAGLKEKGLIFSEGECYLSLVIT